MSSWPRRSALFARASTLSLPLSVAMSLLVGCDRGETVSTDAPDSGGPVEVAGLSGEANAPIFDDPATPRSREAPPPADDLEGALAAPGRGNPEGAVAFLAPHLETAPEDLRASLAYCRALVMLGRYEAVLAFVADSPHVQKPELVRWQARAYMRTGEAAQAEKLLESALADAPDDLALRGDLLDVLVHTGRRRTDRARALRDSLYDAFDAGQVKGPEALLAVAKATLASGTGGGFHDANDVLSEAEQLEPPEAGTALADAVLLRHAEIFLEKYAADEAETTYAMILARDPWQPDALAGVAQTRLSTLRLAAATRSALEALQVNPHQLDAHVVLAYVSVVEGRREEGLQRLEREVFALDPNHPYGQAVAAAAAIYEGDDRAYASAREAALAFDPTGASFFPRLADLLGYLHLYPESEAVLAEAEVLDPQNPYVQSARGLNLLRLGREKEGREALDRAWKRDRFNERTFNTRQLYTERIEPHYLDRDGNKHSLRLPSASAELILPEVDAAISKARAALDESYGIGLGKVRLEVFETPEDFAIRTVGVPSLGALGVCFGQVITVVGPFTGRFNFRSVIWHELSHSYAIELSKGRVPRWFTEGLSEWETELADPAWARESAELLMAARAAGKLRPLSQLELAFLRAENPALMEAAYATATYAVRYLGQSYGHDKLEAILAGYASGATTDALFRQHLGKDLATVEKEFDAWFNAQLDATITGWRPSPAREGARDPNRELLEKAMARVGQRDLEGAEKTLRKLIQGNGDGHLPQLLLGKVLLEQGKLGPARDHFERAAAFHKESTDPLDGLAEVARRAEDIEAEKAAIQRVLEIDAQDLEPAVQMIALSLLSDDPDRLDYALDRALAIAPMHPATLAGWSLRARDSGDKQRARQLLEQATTVQRGPAVTFAIIALAAERSKQRETAKKFAAMALQAGELSPLATARMRGLAGT